MNNLKQGEVDWLTWRKNGIGSSDAPVIMGVSPYKTPYQLWEEKLTPATEDQKSWAQIRGHDLEPIARSQYELIQDMDMPPTLFVDPELDFLRASLDGYNEEASRILEIKCPGKEDHTLALERRIPDKYYPQLQHQLMVSGAKHLHYYSFDGTRGALVTVQRDEEYMKELREKEIEFWKHVQTKTPPPYTDRDFVPIEDESILKQIQEWKEVTTEIKKLQAEVDLLKLVITKSLPAPKCRANGVRMTHVHRTGNIDYGKVPELKDVDLEPYRKKGSDFVTFAIERETSLPSEASPQASPSEPYQI